MTEQKTPTKRRSTARRATPPSFRGPTELTDQLVAAGDRATAYALDVVEGRLIAGPHVRNACRRHLDDLVAGPGRGLQWDLSAAQHVWTWFERILKLSEGQFEAQPFLLHPSQAFKLGCLFGWKRADGTRRFRRAYVEEGKGNGKSPFAGGVGLYMLTADGEAGAQIYSCGAKKEQAAILFADAVKMVKKAPALQKRLTFSGGEGKEYNIAYLKGGGYFRPISKDSGRKGSGPRPHAALADELHEHPDRTSVEMLEKGFKFRRQPMLLMITNSGSDRNSICWEEHQHAVRVAAGTRTPDEAFGYVGEVIDDKTFSYVCALDPKDDPLSDRSCWVKANPLLGTILTEDYLADEVQKALDMPGKLNSLLRLNFCTWTDSADGWITRAALERVLADFDPAEHRGKPVSLGLDLSGTKDLTALAHVVQTGTVTRLREQDGLKVEVQLPTYDAWVEAWTPKDTLIERARADSAPYDIWEKEGWLRAPPGQQVRFDYVAAYIAGFAAENDVRVLAYDRYAFRRFEEELAALSVEILQAEHPQGGKRRAKPTDDQVKWAKQRNLPPPDGLWMPGSLNALEELVLDGRIRLLRSPVLISACMSAATDHDAFDNRWFDKQKATQRIDPVVALAMATGAAQAQGLERQKSFWQ
jgi:phage terminase large subunit-like protein